jgi:hypothetical protein
VANLWQFVLKMAWSFAKPGQTMDYFKLPNTPDPAVNLEIDFGAGTNQRAFCGDGKTLSVAASEPAWIEAWPIRVFHGGNHVT